MIAIPDRVEGRAFIYLLGLPGGVVKVGCTNAPRNRMKGYSDVLWAHFFPHVDSMAACEVERRAVLALSMSGAASHYGREYFTGISKEAATCLIRYVVASFDAAPYESARVEASEAIGALQSVAEIRHENLIRVLIEIEAVSGARGAAQRLASASGVPSALISQLRNKIAYPSGKARNMGDITARNIERGMGKPFGWMDRSHKAEA
jgi:hypothetical protein